MEEIDYSFTSTELNTWPGAQDFKLVGTILIVYLLLVLKIIPSYMKNRPAYNLKTYIIIYNVVQVLSCIYIIYRNVQVHTIDVFYSWRCKAFEQNSHTQYIFNRVAYFTFWIKIVELSETIVFALRKKQNQISFLHVFHHCSTITLLYLLTAVYKQSPALYPITINTCVHVIMYSYYLAAAICSKKVIDALQPVKKSITTIQMIQFCLILLHSWVMWNSCGVPKIITAYYVLVVAVIFYGFYDFYKKSYSTKQAVSLKN